MGRKHRRSKSVTEASPSGPTLVASESSRFRLFRWICAFFFVAALFIRLDVITVWPGAEGWHLDFAMSLERGSYMPAFLHNLLLPLGANLFTKADLFFLFPRLLSATFLLAAAFLYYRWGSRLFGRRVAELQLLAAAGSLWLPFFGKVATADTWVFFGHLGIWLSTLLLLRSTNKKYQLIQGAFVAFSALAAPLSTLVFVLVLYGLLYRPTGYDNIWNRGWGALLVAGAILLLQGTHGDLTYWHLGQKPAAYATFIAYAFMGLLPAIGFAFAGIRDLIFKVRKQEALAYTMLAALLASLASQSLLFPFILAALAGKQMQLYFGSRYPWENWVKGPAILHLIFALIGSFLVLISGLIQMGGEGYRAALGMIAAYWIFNLLAVLGLYGRRRDFTVGGTVLAGLLSVMFFWVQVYPFLEIDRDWMKTLSTRVMGEAAEDFKVASSQNNSKAVKIYVPRREDLSSALPYLRRAGWKFTDAENADYQLSVSPMDTLPLSSDLEVRGRIVFQGRKFKLTKQ